MFSPGDILQQRYQIAQAIGKGSMGRVYMAEDLRLRCFVAVKEALLDDDESRKAFEREAKLLANLSHRGLPKVMDLFSEGRGQFLVMEFIYGEDLEKKLVMQQSPFPFTDVLEWADQILAVLEVLHLHQPPIIHRDIKPANLKLTPEGNIVLLDFGLAKGAAGQLTSNQTYDSIPFYTLAYASSEQINGYGTDPRSDLCSLAMTLYHLMTNVLPPNANVRAREIAILNNDPLRRANELNKGVPDDVANVLHQASSLNPIHRPPTATAMRQALYEASKATQSGIVNTSSALL